MINILFILAFIIIGCAFIFMGSRLVSDCRNKLNTRNAPCGTFERFHYLFGVALSVADVIIGLTAFVTSALLITYPIY